MTLFPFFTDVTDKTFLVIGGGKVAAGKVKRLRQITDNIIVIAEHTDITGVKVINKNFEESDLLLGDFVIGATDNKELNAEISILCKERNIPVNIVDDPALCTFIFPSLIRRGDLTIGICTGGKSPAASQFIRKEIEHILPENIEGILDEMGELREALKREIPDQKERARILKNKLTELMK